MKQALKIILILLSFINATAHNRDTLTFTNPEFVENKGQWHEQVSYFARLSNGSLWVGKTSLTFDIQNSEDILKIAEYKSKFGKNASKGIKPPNNIRGHRYKINFENGNPEVKIEGFGLRPDYNNYFIGNDKSKWASKVPKYSLVMYHNIYQNIDFKIYSTDGFLKWDFIVKQGGNHKDIELHYEGIDKVTLLNGNLVLKTNAGKIVEMRPYSYQWDENGNENSIECSFEVKNNKVRFKLGNYDKTKELIIDPVLVYASYTGSVADNWGYTATYDNYGNIFGGGAVFSSSYYPTTVGAYDTIFNGGISDISITKFNTTNSQLIYSTYLGGSASEIPSSLIVNTANELLILSTTGSSNFPMSTGGYDTIFSGGTTDVLTNYITFSNGADLAISRLSSDGTQLLSSTYFGGSGNDGMNSDNVLNFNYADKIRGEILTDHQQNIYVVSSTKSLNLPTTSNSFQSVYGGNQDGVIVKFDNQLSNIIWCSYMGGNAADALYSISLTQNDDIVITGGTRSANLPTTNGVLFPNYKGGIADGFVGIISKNGTQIKSLSYFGSNKYDQSFFVDTDRKDNVYLYGQSADLSGSLKYNALWSTSEGGQFVSKLTPNLASMVWSTTWGTISPDSVVDVSPSAFMVDLCNRIYMSAWGGDVNYFGTTAGLPVTPGAFQTTTDGSDYYFLTLKDDASAIDYATFYGGAISAEHVDGGTSRFDKTGKLYQSVCAGCGGGFDDFPTTPGCYSPLNNSSNCNNAVIKFSFSLPVVIADFATPNIGCAPYTINFTNTSYITTTNAQCFWDFGNGITSSNCNPSITYNHGGIYNVTLIISDTASCNLADTIIKQVAVIEGHRDTLQEKAICKGDIVQIGLTPVTDPSATYLWNNGSSLSNFTISNPFANPANSTYYTLLFSNGICTDTLVQRVKVYDISADAGNDTTLCFSNITLTAKTNYTGLNYQWSSNPYFTDTLNTNLSDSLLTTTINGPTIFYVKVSHNSLNCYDIDSIKVEPRIVLNNNILEPPKCFGDSNGSIAINPNGGIGPYNFNWSSGQTTATINQLKTGNYTVTVTDQDGCFAITTVQLPEPPLLTSTKAQLNIPCANTCIGKAWGNPIGGTPPYQWQWNDASTQTTNPALNLCDGTYSVTITDNNLCKTFDTITLIDSSIYIIINAQVANDTIYEGQSTQITSTNFGNNYTYTWTPTIGLSNATIPNPIASPTVSTTYYITVRDIWGCEWTDTVFIFVIDVICEEPYIYVPNAFTPNGDGKNDILYVRSSVGYSMDFKIFNRWGELVFQSSDVNNGWDGTYKGRVLEPGVFDYYLSLTCYNRQIFVKKGNITLIR